MSIQLKKFIRPLVPIGVVEAMEWGRAKLRDAEESRRREKFNSLRQHVRSTIKSIHGLSSDQSRDLKFLEKEFIPSLGLNDELLHEQPAELSPYFGKGLHIWQYPNQLAAYLAWLSNNATGVKSYTEIGCRWGGMFILVTEWLRRTNPDLNIVVAIDPINPTPFIEEYFEYLKSPEGGSSKVRAVYLREFSTSDKVRDVINEIKPDFAFIDGDHTLRIALNDHILVRDFARYIVHHDIASPDICPDTTQLWTSLKKLEGTLFESAEFTDQYEPVPISYLGIGVLKRRLPLLDARLKAGHDDTIAVSAKTAVLRRSLSSGPKCVRIDPCASREGAHEPHTQAPDDQDC